MAKKNKNKDLIKRIDVLIKDLTRMENYDTLKKAYNGLIKNDPAFLGYYNTCVNKNYTTTELYKNYSKIDNKCDKILEQLKQIDFNLDSVEKFIDACKKIIVLYKKKVVLEVLIKKELSKINKSTKDKVTMDNPSQFFLGINNLKSDLKDIKSSLIKQSKNIFKRLFDSLLGIVSGRGVNDQKNLPIQQEPYSGEVPGNSTSDNSANTGKRREIDFVGKEGDIELRFDTNLVETYANQRQREVSSKKQHRR